MKHTQWKRCVVRKDSYWKLGTLVLVIFDKSYIFVATGPPHHMAKVDSICPAPALRVCNDELPDV